MKNIITDSILNLVGNTPFLHIAPTISSNIDLYVKLECNNPTGSVKDRAATYIISKVLLTGRINRDTTIVESSSGNFGISLAAVCKQMNLRFLCVIDPKINPINEFYIQQLGAEIIKTEVPDQNGGYLISRIQKVNELVSQHPNSYWVNQYSNPYNAEAYYLTLGEEISKSFDNIDYVFIAVSSGGTITGVSQKIKERHPTAKIIAVDIEGSVIFEYDPKNRQIPGIGSSIVPDLLSSALIDDHIIIDEISSVNACHQLIRDHFILVGGSSGSVFSAIQKYFHNKVLDYTPVVVTIFPDRGDRYSNTIYNQEWVMNMSESNRIWINS